MVKKRTFLLLLLLFLLGLYLRKGALDGFFAFTFDQGRDLLVVKDIIYHDHLRLIGPPSGIEGLFHGVSWYWLIVPLFILANGNPLIIVALFSLLMSVTILLAFYLGYLLFGEKGGLVSAALVAVSHFFVGTSTQLWNPNVVPPIMLLFLITFWLFISNKISFFWVCLFVGAVFEFHIGFGGMLLLAFPLALLFSKTKLHKKNILLGFMGLGIWFIPRILFDLRHDFLQSKSLIAYISHPSTVHSHLSLGQRFVDRILSLWNSFSDSYTFDNKVLGILFIGLCAFSSYSFLRKRSFSLHQKYIKILAVLIAILLLFSSLYLDTLWNYYLIGFPVLFLPFVLLAFYFVYQKNKNIAVVSLLIILLMSWEPWNVFGPKYIGDASVYKNQLQVVSTIYEKANGQPFNTQVYSPSVIDYNYQYLFEWYGQRYNTAPDRVNEQRQVFMIIEPDPWNKGLREKWIKERIGDGKTVWKDTFIGNIEVEQKLRT